MVTFKSILGLVIGVIVGQIVGFVAYIVVWIIVGVAVWDSQTGKLVGLVVGSLFQLAGAIIGFIFPIKEESDRRAKLAEEERKRQQAREEEKRRQREWHKETQQGYRQQMIDLGENSIALFESMPKLLCSAEKYLDQAESDFAEGVFVPFWDSIENAAKTLGSFDQSIHLIKDNLSRYTELIRKYENTRPPFPLARQSVAKLGVGTTTAERMKAIVRTAHRNHDFADIYMQYKTNQILVAGFTNLAQALDRVTWQITASIDALGGSIDVMTSTQNESMRAIHSRMGDIVEGDSQHHDELMEKASESAAREREALKMLDNIQRGRRPFL